MKLGIIVGTVREGRKSDKVAKWVQAVAANAEGVEVTMIDLVDHQLPFFAEPVSPRYNQNRQPEGAVKSFLDALAAQDAYIVVTPEYNHSYPGVLKNALDYIDFQMKRKPAAVVSHSVVPTGGARAGLQLKLVLSELFAVPIQNSIALLSGELDDEGNLNEAAKANAYGPQGSLDALLAELKWYSDALATARTT